MAARPEDATAGASRIFRAIWRHRVWIYAAGTALAVARIPARTGFRLSAPACDFRLTLENLALSVTKVPHVVLFGAFFLLTLIQFDRIDRRSLSLSFAATAALSIIIELTQGATRTGNCRMTDVAPNLIGGFIAAMMVLVGTAVWRRYRAGPAPVSDAQVPTIS